MFAIVDIETTGGKYNEEGITEIAIYKFDGHTIVDQFVSLVNPERPIQPFVVGLTGINNEMLRNAPKFYEVAKRIIEITEDCILVAHNAKFDYRILRTEFDRLGYAYTRKSICTVETSKKLIPGMPSYSLGKLVKNLGIPIANRHRAEGDALATVQLFKLLLNKDQEKTILKESTRESPLRHLDNKLIRLVESASTTTGIYYFHDKNGDIIYIGKSKNIKKRINQHFTSDAQKSRKIQKEVEHVSFQYTGSELIALLKENEEIKRIQPKYNRSLKPKTTLNSQVFSHALYASLDTKGYRRLQIAKADFSKEYITTFTNLQQAKRVTQNLVEDFELCAQLVGVETAHNNGAQKACFSYGIKKCKGACIGEEQPESYNLRVQKAIEKYRFPKGSILLVDQGRELGEKSVVFLEEGTFKGVGYFDLNLQINQKHILEKIIVPMENNRDALHIIQNYRRKNKKLKTIYLD